jgi:hypothetical protein
MSQGRSVKLFLVDGAPMGILTAEIMNWTGHLLIFPRSRLADALKRPEAIRTGVYFLPGEDPAEPSKTRVYIGEGDCVADRLRSHSQDASKDFWTHACIVTSKDANLTKAHVRYLESRLLEIAKIVDRALLANGNEPSAKQLPESDIADMEYFIMQLHVALPTVGFDFLREKPGSHNNSDAGTSLATQAPRNELKLVLESKRNGVFAFAVEANGEVTVMAGALATTKGFVSNSYGAHRQELIETGRLVLSGDGDTYTLLKDTTFRSPSEAAAVLLNRNSNGRTEWRVADTGLTLKAWQDAQLEASHA